jgi:hypothetical protein
MLDIIFLTNIRTNQLCDKSTLWWIDSVIYRSTHDDFFYTLTLHIRNVLAGIHIYSTVHSTFIKNNFFFKIAYCTFFIFCSIWCSEFFYFFFTWIQLFVSIYIKKIENPRLGTRGHYDPSVDRKFCMY